MLFYSSKQNLVHCLGEWRVYFVNKQAVLPVNSTGSWKCKDFCLIFPHSAP